MSAAAIRSDDKHYRLFGNGEAGLVFNNRDGPLRVPGFPYPITVERSPDERFAHGASDWAQDRLTARELAMLGLMNELTDRPGWQSDIYDNATVSQWCLEVLSNPRVVLGRPMLTPLSWDWCVRELRDKAGAQQDSGYTFIFDSAARVCKSDSLVTSELLEQLRTRLGPVFSHCHAQPGQTVTQVVDPSLYPFVYGKTKALYDGEELSLDNATDATGKGWTVDSRFVDPSEVAKSLAHVRRHDRMWESYWRARPQRFSQRFQWLPCEVEFTGQPTATGRGVRITSYINNLHPVFHRSLYQTVEKIVSISVNPWNDILVWRGRGRTPPRVRTFGPVWFPPLPPWANNLRDIEEEPESARYQEARALVQEYISQPGLPVPEFQGRVSDFPIVGADWETRFGLAKAVELKHKQIRHWLHPEPGLSYTYEDWKRGRVKNALVPAQIERPINERSYEPRDHDFYNVSLQEMFQKEGLQVIIEIRSIELTPDQPQVAATEWQLNGKLNEHIVATSILHFDSVNVSPSSGALTFRVEADLDPSAHVYEEGRYREMAGIYDIHQPDDLRGGFGSAKAFQTLGTVLAPDGRLVVFPNVLQHRFGTYRLWDAKNPGRRRVMAVHLVDPHYRILSTRNVPPQRHDWWWAAGAGKIDWARQGVPQEIVDKILRDVGEWPIGREEASRVREEMVEEHGRSMETVWKGAFYYDFE